MTGGGLVRPGRLSVVGTPIGNLSDLSDRARATLAEADAIACEDTRHTRKLLTHEGITGKRLLAVHEHNEAEAAQGIVDLVRGGNHVALVTDAGMPSVSDPGAAVVAAVSDAGLAVEVVPGPSAVVAALAVSGLAADRFCFEGFLPRKGAARSVRLDVIGGEPRAVVIYEAANRVARTLADLLDACGAERRVAVCRELTKVHEEVVRGPLVDVVARIGTATLKGEVAIVLEANVAAAGDELASLRASSARTATGKVVAYVTRPGPEILVFDHVPDHSGVQVPKGTLHPGEDPLVGLLRELEEESGLRDVRVVRALGTVWHHDRASKEQLIHYFHVEPLAPAPDTWEWDECSDGDVPLHRFRFRWLPLDEAERDLHPGWPFTELFPALRASLRR